MSESLDTLLGRTTNPFIPLRVGDMTVGWFAPHAKGDNSHHEGKWFISAGDKAFSLGYHPLLRQSYRFELDVTNDFSLLYRYQSDFVFYLPVGSVDFSGENILFTERSTQNILASFSNLVAVLKMEIQSGFNNSSADEAVETYAKLVTSVYPYLHELSWRGESVEVLEPLLSEAVIRHRRIPPEILREEELEYHARNMSYSK